MASVPGPDDELAPAGLCLCPDPGTQLLAGGTVLAGGSPVRVLRLTTAGARHVSAWLAGMPVPDGYRARTLARGLVARGAGKGTRVALLLPNGPDWAAGYFGCGLIDGPNIHIKGRVGWSCAENMLAGTVVIDKNAGSTFGAALRGGDLVCRGDVGARVGIDMKGGTIIIGGRAGAFCGFMMQRGRMVILGDAGKNLGDSMYDGTIYVGGKIDGLGVDAVPGEMTDLDVQWLERKLKQYGLQAPKGAKNMQKIRAGRQLWNYDNLEPAEKKLIL